MEPEVNWSALMRVGTFDLEAADVERFKRPLSETLTDAREARALALGLIKLTRNVTDEAPILFALRKMSDMLAGVGEVPKEGSTAAVAASATEGAPAAGAPAAGGSAAAWSGGLSAVRERAELFFAPGKRSVDVSALLRLSNGGGLAASSAAMGVLATLLSVVPQHRDLDAFVALLLGALARGARHEAVAATAGALMQLLRADEGRQAVLAAAGVPALVEAVQKHGGNDQLIYELTFCLWCVSYCGQGHGSSGAGAAATTVAADDAGIEAVAAAAASASASASASAGGVSSISLAFSAEAIGVLVGLVAAARREKVVRVAIATLRNLSRAGGSEGATSAGFAEAMIDCGLLTTLENFRERKWTDDDVADDLEAVREFLLRNFRELSSIERYEKEVRGERLAWNHLHSEKFFREHAAACDRGDFKVVRRLLVHLGSPDAVTQAVACSDLGEFARFYPNGRSIIKLLGVKPMVMSLMQSEDAETAQHALLAVSKMMVNNWEFVNR
jgi:V-type H+-transporting ATPase subunit H